MFPKKLRSSPSASYDVRDGPPESDLSRHPSPLTYREVTT
jgi:hypothetical protein